MAGVGQNRTGQLSRISQVIFDEVILDITPPLFVNRSHPLWEFFQLEGEFCKRRGGVSFFFSSDDEDRGRRGTRRGNRGDFFFFF